MGQKNKFWRKSLVLLLVVVVSIGIMRLLISMKPEPKQKEVKEVKRYVKIEHVSYDTIQSGVIAPGRLASTQEVMVVSEAAGKIERGDVVLKKGASFKKGDCLLSIYKDEAELALQSRKSSYLNLIANLLPDIKIDYPNKYDTYKSFFASIKLNESLPALPNINKGDEQLKIFLASRNVLSEYYNIKRDEKALSRYSIYAPFDGVFTQVNKEIGAFTNMGGQLGTIIRTDDLELEVPVENQFSKWIRVGDPVTVTTAGEGKKVSGKVVRKAGFVNPSTQSQSVFVRLSNVKNGDFFAGEYLDAEFPGQSILNVMEIPRNAVFNSDEVFYVSDGKLKKGNIQVVKVNEKTIIFKGLPEGTQLVVQPLIKAQENNQVEILH